MNSQATSSRPAILTEDIDENRLLENMAQEIRTPLNAILGLIELLIDSPLNTEQHEYARLIQVSGDALLVLVNDLLDYAHLGSGELQLTETALDLRSCMDDALDMLASHAAGVPPNIACFIEPGVPEVIQADPIRLRQVLSRLLGYAVQLADGGEIVTTVRARPQGHELYEIQFVIKEYRLLLAHEQAPRPKRDPQAAGDLRLGLEICRLLIDKMGGSLTSGPQQPRDVLFSFTILAEAGPWEPARRRQRSTQPLMGGKNVLLVVADEQQRSSLAQQLSYWQLKPIPAESAAQALEILASGETVDVGILEEHPPHTNVRELAQLIRNRREGRALPLILVAPETEQLSEPPVPLSAQISAPVKPYQLYEAITRMLVEQLRIQPISATSTLLDPGMAQRRPMRILLADQEAGEQKVTLRFLERLGYRPDRVENPADVLQGLLRQLYDVLIVDQEILFGETALLEKIEQLLPPIARPAVLVLAEQAAGSEVKAPFTGNVQDYIFKPVRAGDLIHALEGCRSLQPPLSGKELHALPETAALSPIAITDELVKEDEPPAIAAAFLSQFSRMAEAGTAVLLVQLVDIFTASAARLLVKMQQAVESQDAELLQQAADALKTSSENLGARHLAELCAGISGQAASSSALPEMQFQLRQLVAEYNRARAELERLRKEIER